MLESNRTEEFENAKVTDLLKPINPKSAEDMDILGKWVKHFKERDKPFRVYKSGRYLNMMVIDRTETKAERLKNS
jgi:hypothetical protein